MEVSVSELSSLTFTVSQNVGVESGGTVPTVFSVGSNYPNPFNPQTHFDVGIPETGLLKASIIDMNGREVSLLANEIFQPGNHRFTWNGKDNNNFASPTGVYIIHIRYNGEMRSQKIVLLK